MRQCELRILHICIIICVQKICKVQSLLYMCYLDILEYVKHDKLFTFVLLSFNSDNHRAWQCWWQNYMI